MKKFKAVVFDMDGVIFDSERCIMETWIILAEKYGIEGIEEVFLACTGTNHAKTRQICLDAYGEDFPYEKYERESSEMFHDKYDGGRLPIKPGVFELLDYLKSTGVKIALASSSRRESVVRELTEGGVIDYFDEIIAGDMVSKSKPDPQIYLKACEAIGVAPEDCYAIEDSYNGIRSAAAGKLRPIMVPDLRPADDEMKQLSVAVLDSLNDVITYLSE